MIGLLQIFHNSSKPRISPFPGRALILVLCCVLTYPGLCEIQVARIFGDNMVLQRDTANLIWGWGDPREEVKLSIGNRSYEANVNGSGEWSIVIEPFAAGGPYTISVEGDNSITLNNVMFGEVWLCGGQSNMQYTLRMLGKDVNQIDNINNPLIRQFRNVLDTDYLPKKDLKGGIWEEANENTVPDFSAVAYFFGKALYDSLKVPIGLINISLGATSIETWMSGDALKPFQQFRKLVDVIQTRNKNFDQLNEELKTFRKTWDKDYYLTGPGIEGEWYKPGIDTSDWKTITIPNFWEYDGLDHDGAVWFRKEFDLPDGFSEDSLLIHLNQIDDYDITWVNGVKVGETFGNRNFRNYTVTSDILKEKDNSLVVRVFDIGEVGGFHTSAFWGNPILLGEWRYKPGLGINKDDFPAPDVPNGSIFSYPTLLFNGNIAPVSKLSIKGAIWYQGESNVARAEEYTGLLPSLILDWRSAWGYEFDFLVVQLANYGIEPGEPSESTWAELREAQMNALKVPSTYIAPAIDLGEADDIHPKNKEDVGYRLALGALATSYGSDMIPPNPAFKSFSVTGKEVHIEFEGVGSGLITDDKYGYVRGFQIAGKDRKFYWARARLENDKIIVSGSEVDEPVAVRYAWSDNPGRLNIYNKEGLPLLPFRTDDWELSTSGKVYVDTPHQF